MHTILYIRRASYVWGLIIKGCITKHLLTEKFPALNILCIDGCDVFLVIFASQPYNTSKSKHSLAGHTQVSMATSLRLIACKIYNHPA